MSSVSSKTRLKVQFIQIISITFYKKLYQDFISIGLLEVNRKTRFFAYAMNMKCTFVVLKLEHEIRYIY